MLDDIQGKHVDLSLSKPDMLYRFAHALASPVRIRIMQALCDQSMNVGELSQTLDIPMSTTALAVKTLEEAGLITTETQPGARGSMKLCSRRIDTMNIRLDSEQKSEDNVLSMHMQLGGYSSADGIKPTCGLAGAETIMGEMDNPAVFYSPNRFDAQLIWFRQGSLEYRFSCQQLDQMEIEWLEFSFEACSEAPMYRDPWLSDIAVSINDQRLGIWVCPCDCGGRQGKLTPGWWPALSTQFGFLKTWRVTDKGTYLDGVRISDVTIGDLKITGRNYISATIEVPEDAEHAGGINLFGHWFGDYPQALIMRLGYHLKSEIVFDSENLE
ncbi:MAG: helix-turn-helix domain-containing protein [Clostridia bacterium]|nr:helix-turn-helix domain-containing protein [Clostridia bacterium]